MKNCIFILALAAFFATATATATGDLDGLQWVIDESTCGPCLAPQCPGNGLKQCQYSCRLCRSGDCSLVAASSECNFPQPAFQNVLPCQLSQDLCNRWIVDRKNCTDCRRESCTTEVGFHFCNVICVNYLGQPVPNHLCSGTAPSNNRFPCTPEPCTFSWFFDRESCTECTGPCGSKGVMNCELSCVDQYGKPVSGEYCHTSPPSTELSCDTAPCRYEWGYSDWSDCTGPCGEDCKRVRTRRLFCFSVGPDGTRTEVAYEFCGRRPIESLEEPCVNIPCEYDWEVNGWSPCIPLRRINWQSISDFSVALNSRVPCGPGYQVATVVCQDDEGNIVDPSNCDPATRPESKQECDLGPCPTYEWIYGDWTDCRGDCENGGFQYRRVRCVQILDNGAFGIATDNNCAGLTQEPTQQQCELEIDCRTCKWTATRWGDCRGPCGLNEGVRYRKVHCQCDDGTVAENSVCEEQTGVVWTSSESCITEPCEVSPVFNWIIDNCGPCTPLNYIAARLGERDPCGEGVSICEVKCYNMNTGAVTDDINCRHIKVPQHTFPCSFRPCRTTWVFTAWGPCSTTAPCIRTRTADCMNELGNIVSDRYCEGEKPEHVEKCECPGEPAPIDCTCGAWCQWSPCTTNCGQGTQTRYRRCKEAQHGGRTCQALGYQTWETIPCFARDCPVDCHCTAWQITRNCSVPCGGGTMQLSRKCTEGTNGGLSCQALGLTTLTLTQACNECPCDSYIGDGNIGNIDSDVIDIIRRQCTCDEWSEWSLCSRKCGGFQTRKRNCKEYPNGISCKELGLHSIETRQCGIRNCVSATAATIDIRESFNSATSNLLTDAIGVTFVNDGFIGNSAKFTDGYAQINLAADNNVQTVAFWLKADPSKTIAYGILASIGKGVKLIAVPRFDIAENVGALYYALELPESYIIFSNKVVDRQYHFFTFTFTANMQERVDPRVPGDRENFVQAEKADLNTYEPMGRVGTINSANQIQFANADSIRRVRASEKAFASEATAGRARRLYISKATFYVDGELMAGVGIGQVDEKFFLDRLQADLNLIIAREQYKFDAIRFGYARAVRTQDCYKLTDILLGEHFAYEGDARTTLIASQRPCYGGHLVNIWVDELTTYCYPLIATEVRFLYELGKEKLPANTVNIATALNINNANDNNFIANAQVETTSESSSYSAVAIAAGSIAVVALVAFVVVRVKASRKSVLAF